MGQIGESGHPATDRSVQVVALGAEAAGGHQAEQASGSGPVLGDRGGAVTGAAHDID
ncbi:hypothetical protein GCM10010521_01310 [Streptomyces rameus]|uniref:Uncharacterized protein n=1 Tax=Streptomyces rameus TaxID=68261 RepID=A0ABP6MQ59_9ACTN